MNTLRYVGGIKTRALRALGFVVVIAAGVGASAQSVPNLFTYQGRAFESNGTTPLARAVNFKLRILSHNGSCVLYEEQQNSVDLSATNGLFNLSVGQVATTGGKRTAADPGLSMARIFSNTGTVRATSTDCPGGYDPITGSKRLLRVIIIDGSTTITMSPDQDMLSVPYALVAESLQGYTADKFIQITGAVTQSDLNSVLLKKTELLALAAVETDLVALAAGTSTTYLKANLASTNITNAGNISLGSQKSLQLGAYTTSEESSLSLSTGDKGKTWFNSSTGKMMYWDGTAKKAVADGLTSLNGATDSVQTFATSTSGTAFEITSSGGVHTLKVPMASASSGVGAGLLSNAEYAALASKTYVDGKLVSKTLAVPTLSENGKSIRWNNTSSAWEYFDPATSGSSGVSSVAVGGAPLVLGGTSSAPSISVSYGTGLTLSSSSLVPDFGTASGKVAQGNDARFNPAIAGDTSDAQKFVRVNDGGTAYVYRTVAQVKTDLSLGTASDNADGDIFLVTNTLSELIGNTIGQASARANIGITTTGDALATTASAAAARSTLGLGTMATATATDYLAKADNLSGLASASTARTNLGLGTVATLNTGTGSGNIPVLDGSGKLDTTIFPTLPAVSGANLTSLNGSNVASGTVSASYLPAAGAAAAGIVSTSAQTLAGDKTFSGNVVVSGSTGLNVGMTTAAAKLDVAGQIRSAQADGTVKVDNATSGTVDWNNGNVQGTTSSSACSYTFTNMLDGGAYTLAVLGHASGTSACTFTHAGLTFKYSGGSSPARTASVDAVYTFLRIGTNVYVSYVNDF